MAQVFQCDACEDVASKGGDVQTAGLSHPASKAKELCIGCFEKVMKIVEPPPRKARAPYARE